MFNYQSLNEQQVLEGVKKFGPSQGAKKVLDWEYDHAQNSIQTGIYITWWNQEKKMECARLGANSKCFCGHLLDSHNENYFGKKRNISCKSCQCKEFKYIPQRPEECGMYWLTRRKDFNVTKWRPPCKCNHNHEEHNVNYPLKCQKCQCYGFDSYFACISCDERWEHHETLFETEMDRRNQKKTVGQDYLPLATNKEIQQEVFGKEYQINEQYTWQRPDIHQGPKMIKMKQPQTKQQIQQNDLEEQKIVDINSQVFPYNEKTQQSSNAQKSQTQQKITTKIPPKQTNQQQKSVQSTKKPSDSKQILKK